MIYLACPYSHSDRTIRIKRFEIANRIAAELLGEGFHVFSPISHSHPIAEAGNLPKEWDFWKEYDKKFLTICNKMIVIKAKGWEESVGVQAEIKEAIKLGMIVEYIDAF